METIEARDFRPIIVESGLVEKTHAELVRREQEFEHQEQQLNSLYRVLLEFQRRYQRLITPRSLILNKVRAQLTEAQHLLRGAYAFPGDQAGGRRERRVVMRERNPPSTSFQNREGAISPGNIKRLYREIVRLVHPDHASSDSDRALRHQYMVEVNQAYEVRDHEWLQNILRELRRRVELNHRDGNSARYQLLIRRLDEIEEKLGALASEIESLTRTDLYRVYVEAQQAQAEGRDLLEEMAIELDDEIERTKARGYDILLKLYRRLDASVRN